MTTFYLVLLVGTIIGLGFEWYAYRQRTAYLRQRERRNDALRLAAKIGAPGLKSDRHVIDRRVVPMLRGKR